MEKITKESVSKETLINNSENGLGFLFGGLVGFFLTLCY